MTSSDAEVASFCLFLLTDISISFGLAAVNSTRKDRPVFGNKSQILSKTREIVSLLTGKSFSLKSL